jgi:ABC-type Na+ efflux pump permease subunit
MVHLVPERPGDQPADLPYSEILAAEKKKDALSFVVETESERQNNLVSPDGKKNAGYFLFFIFYFLFFIFIFIFIFFPCYR